MKKLFLLPFFSALLSCTLAQKQEVKQNYETILFNTGKMLEVIHYDPKPYNNAFSQVIFREFFATLDPQKKIFLQSDIDRLRQYETAIDEEIQGGTPKFFRDANEVYVLRLKEAQLLSRDLLSRPFDFTTKETFRANNEKAPFPASANDRKERWRQSIKYQVMEKYEDLAAGKGSTRIDSIEQKARALVSVINERFFKNLLARTSEEEAFSTFLNTIVQQFDPHSSYYLPVDRREFVEDLSGVYYGIGALLEEQNGNISIGELMIGGPAWRSQLVEKGDVIIRVTQAGEQPVSVEGYTMPELIKLTRGKKDSKVTITFRKADGTLRDVAMTRTALQLEDTFVKTAVIADSTQKIGYIFLPKFYTDFGDENGRSCADDMEKAVLQLKEQQVDGIVIDIRNNGGGSLGEVIDMVGLFVDKGPVVQVKSRGERSEVGKMNKQKIYDGPLVVMVNELSASASEIFAGAIQDYKRGIIVGSTTFGKGTVQRAYRIPGKNWSEAPTADLGTLHLTIQKYYRVTGSSTQLKGIQADVSLPGLYEHYNVREKDTKAALPWDEIKPVPFLIEQHTGNMAQLINRSISRQERDSSILLMKQQLDWLADKEDVYPLELEAFRKHRAEKRERIAQVRKLSALVNAMQVHNTPVDAAEMAQKEQFRQENNKAWLNSLQKDRFLFEAVAVLKDLQVELVAGLN